MYKQNASPALLIRYEKPTFVWFLSLVILTEKQPHIPELLGCVGERSCSESGGLHPESPVFGSREGRCRCTLERRAKPEFPKSNILLRARGGTRRASETNSPALSPEAGGSLRCVNNGVSPAVRLRITSFPGTRGVLSVFPKRPVPVDCT